MNQKFQQNLILNRDRILANVISIFEQIAIEAHLLGSVARGNPDPFSDVDIWITVDDNKWDEFTRDRLKYFSQVGEIIHICEPPQNAPLEGIFSSVFYKANDGILVTDFYLCPKKSAFKTLESKNLFGNLDLPTRELSLNPQQVAVPESYRIDFFICFIFGTIKKIVRKKEDALDLVLQQYKYLNTKYDKKVKELEKSENKFDTLINIIENTKEVATPDQVEILNEIYTFINKVRSAENL